MGGGLALGGIMSSVTLIEADVSGTGAALEGGEIRNGASLVMEWVVPLKPPAPVVKFSVMAGKWWCPWYRLSWP